MISTQEKQKKRSRQKRGKKETGESGIQSGYRQEYEFTCRSALYLHQKDRSNIPGLEFNTPAQLKVSLHAFHNEWLLTLLLLVVTQSLFVTYTSKDKIMRYIKRIHFLFVIQLFHFVKGKDFFDTLFYIELFCNNFI